MRSLLSLVAAGHLLTASVVAQEVAIDPSLVGTWTTKSRKVFTGPGFYDPVNEEIFEPDLTGISYSFTQDGYYEEAFYRAIPNPINPACPRGIIQWQHGTFTQNVNGSLILTPFGVDGRQLLSDPCNYKNSIYTRYNQTETFVKYEQLLDTYNHQQRLNLYEWDGTPMNPMWLAYSPPEMLPTSTLNPTAKATSTPATSTGTAAAKVRRNLGLDGEVVNEIFQPVQHLFQKRAEPDYSNERWFWIGVTMTGFGGLLYMFTS